MAPRSHPPTLRALALRLVREQRLWQRGDVVLCACSGGPDSTAMLHVLAMLRGKIGHRLLACGVDHGLRAEAAAELAHAARLAEQLGVPFTVLTHQLAGGANLQARARELRHRALAEHARRHAAGHIALGHSADDRAETLLIRLVRGAGPRGLAVMPASAGSPADPTIQLTRPLLWAPRAAISAHLKRHRLSFASDPSNRDRRFLRTRVRHDLIPLLEELNPQIIDHLCALADMLRTPEQAAERAPLGRAQRRALDRALLLRQPTTLRLRGGYELSLVFSRPKAVRKPKA